MLRKPSVVRRNPVERIRDEAARQAQLAVAVAAAPQAVNGAADSGSIDGSGNWQPAGRWDVDGWDTTMRWA
jgi:hypothetical protein